MSGDAPSAGTEATGAEDRAVGWIVGGSEALPEEPKDLARDRHIALWAMTIPFGIILALAFAHNWMLRDFVTIHLPLEGSLFVFPFTLVLGIIFGFIAGPGLEIPTAIRLSIASQVISTVALSTVFLAPVWTGAAGMTDLYLAWTLLWQILLVILTWPLLMIGMVVGKVFGPD